METEHEARAVGLQAPVGRRRKHWMLKLEAAFTDVRPVQLSAGDAAELWRCLTYMGVTTPEQADCRATAEIIYGPNGLVTPNDGFSREPRSGESAGNHS